MTPPTPRHGVPGGLYVDREPDGHVRPVPTARTPARPAMRQCGRVRGGPSDWLLDKEGRGNPRTRLDDQHPGGQAWSEGNLVRPLVHGATYFAELYERLEATGPGDLVLFTDWQGDADERLTGAPGSEVSEVLGRADERGADVRGLVWRSHSSAIGFTSDENLRLGRTLQKRGVEAILDMRVRTGGSHHQKMLVIRHGDDPTRDIAYVGGIDLCHSRRDDADHGGDPQALDGMAEEYGATPPWHDLQAAISGPAVHDVETVFRERWEDPTTLSRSPVILLRDRLRGLDTTPDPLPEQAPPPPPVPGATHAVQLLRTYPNLRQGRDYAFARGGERSVARGYTKAVERARRLVYVEDQYLWGHHVGDVFTEALKTRPDLHVIAVVPMHPDVEGLNRTAQLVGPAPRDARHGARRAGPGRGLRHREPRRHPGLRARQDLHRRRQLGLDRLGQLQPPLVDPRLRALGRRRRHRRRVRARRLRLDLAAEHLDRDPEAMDDCLDPAGMFAAYAECAAALDAWHDGGEVGPRPPGRLRRLQPPEIGPVARTLALPAYLLLHDPDGRPKPLQREDSF